MIHEANMTQPKGVMEYRSDGMTSFRMTGAKLFSAPSLHHSIISTLVILVLCTFTASAADRDNVTADVCVYGGTSGGVVAAVQAARMGKRVVLVEPGRHLGGMMAGGLSWSDVGSAERAKLFGGLAREVFQRIGKHYGQDPEKVFEIAATKIEGRSTGGVDFIRPPSLAFEPKVAERAFNELAREAGVKVLLESRARKAVKDGKRIVRIELEDGGTVTAKMFIDATYEGDLMALAGVSYTVGRESNERYNETMNGVRGPEHGPSSGRFSVKVDPFVKPGDPSSGLLPLIAGGAPQPIGSADKRIQSYNFRLCLTDDPANRAPLERPADYDPAQWELLGRYVVAMTMSGRKLTLRSFCKYDPLPNGKFDFNNRWPISTDMLGGAHGWPEGTAEERARIAKAHEDYLRGLFHFLRTDPRVPANVREEMARFGLPKDEFTDNGNWPHQIYVREARRMVSDFVMTEHHIRNREVAPNGISLATYPMDIHAVRRVYHDGKLYNEGFGGGGGRPAPIGYGAIVPKAAECENLFVTFALSASHAAFGSIRMEPVFMVSSQSAATAACLAIDADTSVQNVDQAKLRARLLADGQILAASSTPAAASNPKIVKASRLPGIVMDDDKAEFQGDWMLSNAQPTPIGGYYRHDGNTDRGKKSATFTATVPKAGDYEIRFLYSPHDNRSTKTKVTVTGAGEEKTFRINQREPVIKDGVPNALGVFRIEAGAKVRATVSNEGADSYVVVDGLQILPVEIAREERDGKRPSGYAMSKPPAQPAPSAAPRRKPLKVKPVRSSSAAEVRGKTYDVVVIGGTPGGIACSVRAAREGLTVLLVQHNRHIGGMLTSGLMQWDALYGGPRSPIFNEYAKSIEDYYRETYGPDSPQFRKARYTQQHYPMSLFECGVAEHLFNQLVSAEANITTLLSHYPAEIQRDGAALKTLTLREYGTQNDITVTGVTYVDATYEGDLAALAKVPYRVGREGRDEYDEPHAGKLFTNISKEAGSQDAKAGKLNLRLYGHSQGTVDPKSPRTADRAVQAYNYRFSLSNEPGNIRLPKKPPGYKREEYVDYYRRFMGAGRLNGKASFNAAILPGENHTYPEATWPEREKIIERHRNFALGLMWFLQNDESVRPESRERYRSIGLPLDEFPDNDNIPYEMYVREARRIVGRHVFTEHDNRAAPGLTRPPIHADSIAFTDWAMDSHDCTWDRSPGYAYDGKLILTEESRPAQIPWRSLLPSRDCGMDNLIVPVCLSATHVAWGTVRLEPVWMMTGEAAGLAAALARKQGVTPGQLDADLLQRALCEKRHFVSFFNDLEAFAEHPAMPAAQYFAARGFFPDYNARLDEPLTESVNRIWGDGLSALREGSLDAMAFAQKVKQAEAADSPKLKRTRGDAMLSMWRAVSGVHRRAAFVEEPRIFIRHGERRRRFIGPHAIELPNGDLLMSAPWGRPPADIAEEIVANHPVPDLYRSKDRGRTWTNAGRLPVKWEHRGFVSDGGVSFLRLADGRLALLLHRHIRGFKGGGLPAICFSGDDGKTWTDPILLAGPEDEGVWYVMNDRLVQTRAGRLLVPVARAVGKFEGDRDESLVFYSDDAGKTWKSSQPAPLPDGPRGMAEPCVIELKDGRLLMMARGGLGVLLTSHSGDGGLTWSRGSPTKLTSPLSSFTLRRLPDGRLIVFYNHAAPSRPGGAFPRCPLAYAVSADEGKTWSAAFVIDDEGLKPASGDLPDMAHVYPGITFLKEGMLVLYSSHMTRNRFGYRAGDVPWKPEQLARTGGKVALLAYPPEKLPYPPAKPAGIVLDDGAAEYTGAWKVGERLTPLVGFSYRHDDRPSKLPAVAKFTPDIPAAGKYEVRLLYISNPNRAQNVPITIRCVDGEQTLTQNQRTPCLVNGVPRSLGVFEFAKGKSGSIEISNQGADGYVIIDGLQLVPEETAKTERANGEDAGFPLKTVAATGPVKIPPPMQLKTAAKPEQVDGKSYDLVVIGGTPGGIACAVRAAREGLNVLLVNHTQHIGGFMTSGAGGWEAPYDGLRSPIYGEMLTSAAAYYRDTYGEGSPQHLASMPSRTSRRHLDRPKIEPRIAELLFNRMVEKEKTLTVLLGHIVTEAERDGRLLKNATLQPTHGEDRVTVTGSVFADAMYEGDLMAVANVKTQIGRESREQYGEPHAGVIYTKKRRLEPGRRGYPEVADKGALNIRYNPTSTAAIVEGPHSGEADDSVMAYNYRLILTRDPANRIMVAKPVNFDLELAKAASGGGFVPNLPNRKVAWNGGRLVGPQNGYPNGDWTTREAISKRYLDAMLMRLWWMQNDPAAPKRFRDQFEGYGLAADEFPDNNHMPYEIYVREARRLVGRYVFKEQDNVIAAGLARTPIHSDSIAITDWPMDSVACLPRNAPGGGADGILFLSEESRPAQVPYRSLLPVELDNLLVPVALSASHVGWGSIRLEPVWMQTGEAAGFAAALAVKEQTTPAALNPDTLIRKLAASRVVIAFFNDMDAASDDPEIPAAQYFATKGFFPSYNARLNEPLTEAVQRVWDEGLAALRKGRLDPMTLSRKVRRAEATDSRKLKQTRSQALQSMWREFTKQ